MNRIIRALLAAAAALAVPASGGCSGDKPPVCQSLAAVQNTVEHIQNTDVSENGLGQLRSYLSQLGGDLRQLSTDAKSQFPSEAQHLRDAADNLTATASLARSVPNVANLAAVRGAVTAVGANVQTLRTATNETC